MCICRFLETCVTKRARIVFEKKWISSNIYNLETQINHLHSFKIINNNNNCILNKNQKGEALILLKSVAYALNLNDKEVKNSFSKSVCRTAKITAKK